jgi:hypothetical protein
MNKLFKFLLVIVLLASVKNIALAETTIHLDVTPCYNNSTNDADQKATPYCTILQSGIQNSWDWKWESSMGALLSSLNNLTGRTEKDADGNDVYYYWNWSLNSNSEFSALNKYELKQNDTITLTFTNSSDLVAPLNETTINFVIDSIKPIPEPTPTPDPVVTSAPVSHGGGGGYIKASLPVLKQIFNLKKALDFLTTQQKDDGSFGENLYTDWVALTLAGENFQAQTIKLIKYFEGQKLENPSLTDYERHAMALMALGLNPYNTNGENYINNIITSFDGKQFGDTNADNDDIFALIVLQNSGYSQNDKIIANDINFILSKQNTDGSWDGSVDMTGAAIEALASFKNTDPLLTSPLAGGEEITNALTKAENYLKQNQKDDGSWDENASSTAWAMEGILALGEKPEDWIKNPNTPIDYLATLQDTDGGIKDSDMQNRIWKTAYVVSALSGKTWNQAMQKFEKETAPKVVLIKKIPTEKKIPAVASIPKKIESNTAKQNTASVINAITPPPVATQTETLKKNWFMRLLNNIFGFN